MFGEYLKVMNQYYIDAGYWSMKPEFLSEDQYYGADIFVAENGTLESHDYYENESSYNGLLDYLVKEIEIWEMNKIGCQWTTIHEDSWVNEAEPDWTQYGSLEEIRQATRHDSNYCWYVGNQYVQKPYVTTETVPAIFFFDTETAQWLSDTQTALNEYAREEIAKFVTGTRPLTDEELTDYFDTLDGLGAQEYIKTYADYYENLKASMAE